MLLVRLLSFLRGYVTVEITGRYPERLINICAARGIFLWNICRRESGVTACMSIKGFKKLPSVAKKASCRIRIIKRSGFPFILHRHRKRYVFAAGIAVLLITCHIMSLFIWKIEIIGADDIDRTALMESLARHGLSTGVLASSVDNEQIKRGVMMDMEELSWIGVDINGSGARVEVRKRTPKPDIEDKDKACSLVASRNGVITGLNISQGVTYVSLGNVVYEGQLLVSGIIESTQAGIRTVAAAGEVTATTWYEKTGVIPDKKEVRTRTGKTKSKHTLEIFGLNIPLFFSDKVSFDEFDRESRVNKLWENDKFSLPFAFHYDKFYDVEISYEKITPQQGEELIKEQLCSEIEKELSPSAQVKNISTSKGSDAEGRPTLTVVYECSENIAQEKEALYEPIGENTGSGENGGDN